MLLSFKDKIKLERLIGRLNMFKRHFQKAALSKRG